MITISGTISESTYLAPGIINEKDTLSEFVRWRKSRFKDFIEKGVTNGSGDQQLSRAQIIDGS